MSSLSSRDRPAPPLRDFQNECLRLAGHSHAVRVDLPDQHPLAPELISLARHLGDVHESIARAHVPRFLSEDLQALIAAEHRYVSVQDAERGLRGR